MANLKEIRDRIKSVKNTRKITEAMRLVAAAKVRRAQDLVLRSRPFADRLARVLESLQSRIALESADTPLLQARDPRHITLVAMTGDRGLCGGFNANIIKRTEQRFAELKASGYEVALITVGRKVDTYFQNRNYPITASFTGLDQLPTSTDALQVSDAVQPALAQTGPPEGGGRVWRRARRAEAGSRRGEVAGVAAGQWIEWLLRQRRQGLLEFCATQ